jgi:CRP-like cAMP-binding protein
MDNSLFLKALMRIAPLSPTVAEAFLKGCVFDELPADKVMLRKGQVADFIYFVQKGSARIFYHKGGREVTEWLALDQEFLMSITSFFQREPSRLIIHTLEASEIWSIPRGWLYTMAAQHHEVETLFRKMLEGSLILSQKRMETLQFETAASRYANLIQHNTEIIKRVPVSYIASFLGITQETLSRIRGAQAKK